MKVQVVVVGAGACGLTAALAAREAGAEVLVLERDASPSGSSALSSGFVPAAYTRFQAAAGVEDSPELVPPYYAVKVTGALFHTQGGLAIDERARVLDGAGKPLPRLFAGGGAACGVSGPRAAGYLSGNGLLSAVVLGRIAGREAAA